MEQQHQEPKSASADRFDINSVRIQNEIEDWGNNVTAGIVTGMVYGGYKEVQASTHWQPFLPSQAGSRTWNERQKLWRNVWEQRTVKVAGGTVTGGAKVGAFVAMLSATQRALKIYRDVDDAFNTAAAASLSGAILGLVLPGSLRWRVRSSLLGIVLGAVAGLPLGYLQSTMDRRAEEEMQELQQQQQAAK